MVEDAPERRRGDPVLTAVVWALNVTRPYVNPDTPGITKPEPDKPSRMWMIDYMDRNGRTGLMFRRIGKHGMAEYLTAFMPYLEEIDGQSIQHQAHIYYSNIENPGKRDSSITPLRRLRDTVKAIFPEARTAKPMQDNNPQA